MNYYLPEIKIFIFCYFVGVSIKLTSNIYNFKHEYPNKPLSKNLMMLIKNAFSFRTAFGVKY